ncbi:MAG: hypothetical protein QNJ13_14505 [Paracoccaceae bacterium]|nr:hypothetical protein [Paracoccaceae bacterium]
MAGTLFNQSGTTVTTEIVRTGGTSVPIRRITTVNLASRLTLFGKLFLCCAVLGVVVAVLVWLDERATAPEGWLVHPESVPLMVFLLAPGAMWLLIADLPDNWTWLQSRVAFIIEPSVVRLRLDDGSKVDARFAQRSDAKKMRDAVESLLTNRRNI